MANQLINCQHSLNWFYFIILVFSNQMDSDNICRADHIQLRACTSKKSRLDEILIILLLASSFLYFKLSRLTPFWPYDLFHYEKHMFIYFRIVSKPILISFCFNRWNVYFTQSKTRNNAAAAAVAHNFAKPKMNCGSE